jgi:hypothetical protein
MGTTCSYGDDPDENNSVDILHGDYINYTRTYPDDNPLRITHRDADGLCDPTLGGAASPRVQFVVEQQVPKEIQLVVTSAAYEAKVRKKRDTEC